jgi:AraC-like DNA-binding protein
MTPLVVPVACRALLEACERLGMDAGAVAARAGLSGATLRDPDARVPATKSDALWREAFTSARDPRLALHAAEAVRFGSYRVLDYLGTTGPALGDGLRRVAAYFRLIDPRGTLHVIESERAVELVFESADGSPLPDAAQEYTLAVLLLRAREATAEPWNPLRVSFTFAPPHDIDEHVRVFRVRPRFRAAAAAIALSRDTWELPTRSPDPELFALLDAHARVLLDRAPAAEKLVERVRLVVGTELPGAPPSLSLVARRLGTSPRSLQRRLDAGATSYTELVDSVRRERAETFLLARDVSLAEVSWLVGFSDQSAFTRAFKRWTGRTPSEYRRAVARLRPRRRDARRGRWDSSAMEE